MSFKSPSGFSVARSYYLTFIPKDITIIGSGIGSSLSVVCSVKSMGIVVV